MEYCSAIKSNGLLIYTTQKNLKNYAERKIQTLKNTRYNISLLCSSGSGKQSLVNEIRTFLV